MPYLREVIMQIYYLQNENQEIIEDGFERFNPKCKVCERENYHIVNGYNGALFFYEYTQTEEYKQKAESFKEKSRIRQLRRRRDEECFSIINRGALWYEKLAPEEKSELAAWYQGWLDVTETGVAPETPEWLKEK